MKQTAHEDLSRMMDGDLGRDLCRFLARRIAREAPLRQRWDRYHLVRCYLQDGEARPVGAEFLQGIREGIADVTPEPAPRRLAKPLVGAAVAASVAVLALVGVNRALLDQTGAAGGGERVAAQADPPQGFSPRSNPLDQQFQAPAVPVNLSAGGGASQPRQGRLNEYVTRHNQMVGQGGRMGFVSYLPIVVTDQPVGRWVGSAPADEAGEAAEAGNDAAQGKR